MQFQAAASVPQCGRKTSALCRAQSMLHSNDSLFLPCALMLAVGGLIVYEHTNSESRPGYSGNSIRNFMALISATMIPLAFLEKKVLACKDPVGVIAKFSPNVLLLHASFLAVRVPMQYFVFGFDHKVVFAFVGFVSACAILHACLGFRLGRATYVAVREAVVVMVLSFAAALVTEAVNSGSGSFASRVAEAWTLYLELLAFVPAVWMVCREGVASARPPTVPAAANVVIARRRAVALFAFLICFYFTEDIVAAFNIGGELPLAALAHVGHYMLLLDFAGFLLTSLYDPEKLNKVLGSLTNLFYDACAV